jgi:predicted branched-subunit amino acid permease
MHPDQPSALSGRTPAQADRRAAFAGGARAFAPAVVATAAWALVTGVAMVRSGLALGPALAMSAFVYAGSAQLASLPLIVAGAPIWVVLLTATIVNLRFVVFSAGMQPYFRHLSLPRRLVLGYLTGDVGYLLMMRRFTGVARDAAERSAQIWFFAGLAISNWLVWQALSLAGILLAHRIPPGWGMDFIGVLALITLLAPSLTEAPAVVGVLVACAVAIAGNALPLKLSVLAAVLAGVAAAMAVELAQERRPASSASTDAQGARPDE